MSVSISFYEAMPFKRSCSCLVTHFRLKAWNLTIGGLVLTDFGQNCCWSTKYEALATDACVSHAMAIECTFRVPSSNRHVCVEGEHVLASLLGRSPWGVTMSPPPPQAPILFEWWLVRGRSIVKDSWASGFLDTLWGQCAPNMRGLGFYHPHSLHPSMLPNPQHICSSSSSIDCDCSSSSGHLWMKKLLQVNVHREPSRDQSRFNIALLGDITR